MSVDRDTDVDVMVDLEGDSARAVVTERRELEIDDLFVDGELRLWNGPVGWNGFVRTGSEDDPVYRYVNTRHDGEWHEELRVGEQAVRDAIRRHIKDPDAGGVGNFVRGCSPP